MNKYMNQQIYSVALAHTIFSIILAILSLPLRALIFTFGLLMRYTWKIVFYGSVLLIASCALLLLCSLYVVTLGTLHFP